MNFLQFKHKVTIILFLFYLALGTFFRWQYWQGFPEDVGDYGSFAVPAMEMKDPYDTGIREPFHVWILKIWFSCTGIKSPDQSFKIGSALGFIWFPLILFLSMKFCESYFGHWQTWIMGWIQSISNFQIFHEFLGLREPVESILILLLLFQLIPQKKELFPPIFSTTKKWKLVCLAGCLVLTRSAYLQILIILLPIFFWLNHWKFKQIFFILGLAAILLLPNILHNFRLYGDPAYFTHWNLGALWTRDWDHRKGYPYDAKDWYKTGDFNNPMTLKEFLFKAHHWTQIPSILLTGFYKFFLYSPNISGCLIWRYPLNTVFKKMLPFHLIVMFFYLMGYLAILKTSTKRRFIIFFILMLSPYILIGHIQVNLRYWIPIAPLFSMILAQGMIFTLREIPNFIGFRKPILIKD